MPDEANISRREFIKDAGLIAGSAAIGSIASLATAPVETASAQATPVSLEIFDPTGAFEVTQTFAPRIDTLAGKTVCFVTNGSWEASRTDPYILGLLQKQFPTAKFIPSSDLPKLSTTIEIPGLEDALKKVGCQAAIVGNAG